MVFEGIGRGGRSRISIFQDMLHVMGFVDKGNGRGEGETQARVWRGVRWFLRVEKQAEVEKGKIRESKVLVRVLFLVEVPNIGLREKVSLVLPGGNNRTQQTETEQKKENKDLSPTSDSFLVVKVDGDASP